VAFVVFDIDGVVADVRHRLHHLARRPPDWRAFFGAAAVDPPLAEGVDLAAEYLDTHDLVWLTGRPEFLRPVTEEWLRRQGLPVEPLLMRPAQDRRPAREYKADRLRMVAALGAVELVVDDDPAVAELLTAQGWPVRLAEWVPYSAPLRQAQERDGRT
jgi:hypothetical protein